MINDKFAICNEFSEPKVLQEIFDRLYAKFGPMGWWPGDTQIEIIIGAILTQNTAWSNVEKAIANLKREGLLSPQALRDVGIERLAELIKPSGYYNQKAKKIKHFIDFLFSSYNGSLNKMFETDTLFLRENLLIINGIGPETADSILLYAGGKPVFVVDAYTKRILGRHNLCSENAHYPEVQALFIENLPKDVQLFNEYHALFVRLGKETCKKREPLCKSCPLGSMLFNQGICLALL
ncbi:endonuclease III domain-containing protein [bacterium]|nr:endonuclease III domain-containing protein [bacterium]